MWQAASFSITTAKPRPVSEATASGVRGKRCSEELTHRGSPIDRLRRATAVSIGDSRGVGQFIVIGRGCFGR